MKQARDHGWVLSLWQSHSGQAYAFDCPLSSVSAQDNLDSGTAVYLEMALEKVVCVSERFLQK